MKWTNFFCLGLLLAGPLCAQEQTSQPETRLAIDELRNFVRVFEQIRQAYVEEIPDDRLFDMAIRGLLVELDPHSELLTRRQREDLQDTARGQFSGIGVELVMRGDNLTVVSPLDASPAALAGILPGDIIRVINDQDITGFSLRQALRLLDGEVGEKVDLKIERDRSRNLIEFQLIRDRLTRRSVSSRIITDQIGYLRISQFTEETGREFRDHLSRLVEDSSPIGLIVDLRNNPGGLLLAAVDVADSLLDGQLIVTTAGRIAAANENYYASAGALVQGMPVVVLINRGSASAAEIVAGAWQDQKRALIMGETSFGKGSIQEVLTIDENLALKLTVARYYTPSGRSIQAQGIYPDVRVDAGTLRWNTEDGQVTEAALARALPSEATEESSGPTFLGLGDTLSDIQDAQLAMAVTLLRGKHLMERD
jgi:carboxyl-terminal processing protease